MKKIILGGIAVIAIAVAVAFNVNIGSQKNNVSSLSLANIEALAQESTSVGYCYLKQSFGTNNGWKKFCYDKTDDTTIFDCPSSETYGGYSESAKDRCTT